MGYTQALSMEGELARPGISRHELITRYTDPIKKGPTMQGPGRENNIWPDDIHSRQPHQQYSDFLKSKMYRNDRLLVTCSDCHDMHGGTPYSRSLINDPDDSGSPLCQRCHQVDVLSHMETELNAKMKGELTSCIACHMSGTANAGGIAGEPIDVVQGELTGLPIPAHAEIAIEGEVPPPDDESRMEGPYREWPVYYTQDLTPQPVIRVKGVYHRNDPILLGPPGSARHISSGSVTPAALAVLEALERTALPGIRGVWAHCNGLFIVVAVEQQFAGHAKMALLTALGARGTTSAYRYYVAVDEDIDPTNLQDVLWAMTTRCDPENQIDIVRGTTSALIDPIISPQKRAVKDLTCGRVLIDACKPWAWIEDFGKSTTFTPEYERQVRSKYAELLRQNGLPETGR